MTLQSQEELRTKAEQPGSSRPEEDLLPAPPPQPESREGGGEPEAATTLLKLFSLTLSPSLWSRNLLSSSSPWLLT